MIVITIAVISVGQFSVQAQRYKYKSNHAPTQQKKELNVTDVRSVEACKRL
jgi:hypothetical protein